jgi:hypothetical protein
MTGDCSLLVRVAYRKDELRRTLNIRIKTFAVIGLTFAVLVASLYWLTSHYLHNSFGEVEQQDTRRNVDRAQSALEDSLARLDTTAGDWAGWDAAYLFIQGKHPGFIAESLTPGTISGINVNLIAFFKTNGKLYYGTGFDLQKGVKLPIPPEFRSHLNPGSSLLRHTSLRSSKSGLLGVDHSVWMVVSRPILTGNKEGPIRGTLVMGQRLDGAELHRLERLTNLNFSVRLAPPDLVAPLPIEPAAVIPLNEKMVLGRTRLTDIYGRPKLLLDVQIPRSIWQQGEDSRRYMLLSMIVLCLAGSLMTLLLLEKMVIGRVRLLESEVGDITSRGDFSRRVSAGTSSGTAQGDELSTLATTVNELLTAVERSTKNLQESEKRFRTFMDNSPAIAFIKDERGRLMYVNATFERMLQCKGEDVLGLTDDELFPPEIASQLQAHDREVLEKQRLIEVEEQVPRSDGSTSDFVVFKFPLSDSSGHNVIAGMAIDITERKAMDRMKNEFISVVSHELRTPVTSIRGAIGLIIGGAMGEVPHGMGPLLQIANKNSIRLAELLNDILDLGKIESGQLPMTMELLEIEPLAAIAVDINGPYAREHHTHFVLESEVAEAKVMGDSDRLQQVMANLLSNAAKYSPPERSVRVRVERIRADGHPWIRVSVTNWGPPIPTSFHSRIFSKFAQADSSTTRVKGGTGLGLSISKAIIEKLGGRIGFTSSETEGTTFYFDLREVV